jgi:hypothetical protein
MKKSAFFLIAVLAAAIPFANCQQRTSRSHSVTNTRTGSETRINVTDNWHSFEITTSGEIAFNDEETAIKSISPGGYIRFKKDKNGLPQKATPMVKSCTK